MSTKTMNPESGNTRGILITFEGIEGCGKTTQMTRLEALLTERGLTTLTTLEPGEGPIGRRIREDLLTHHPEPLDPLAELMLYLADRAQHVARILTPALRAGKIVLCDRYTDSTVAYQGYGRRIDLKKIQDLNAFVTRGLTPDITFLLDCPPEVGLKRIRGDLDRMESQDMAFHRRVREGYLSLAKEFPDRIVLCDATRPVEDVFRKVTAALLDGGLLGGI